MKWLRELCPPSPPELRSLPRRGGAGQWPRRQREHRLRGHVVALADWAADFGWTRQQIADGLQLCPRTLRQWQSDVHQARWRMRPLGRPVVRSSVAQRNEVIALLEELGPAIGVPALQACFPAMARAELADLRRRYRRIWRKRRRQPLHVLHWPVPGSVWAIDFAEPSEPGGEVLPPIDGSDAALLAVRDLGSGRQLAWLPVAAMTAAETIAALASLFALYGPPLVLKSDNGSPFIAETTLAFLADAGVLPLFSPPYTPRYNGAIEASIGSLKTRTQAHAARHGRVAWTRDDVAAARAEANATARPRGPTPDQAWTERRRLTALDRALFQAAVTRRRTEARAQPGWPSEGPLPVPDDRAIDRIAIPRALVEHGYLLFSRRRIPLPFRKRKAANIT